MLKTILKHANRNWLCEAVRSQKNPCVNDEIDVLLNMAFNVTKPIWALICLHEVTPESIAALTDHFASAFV